MTRRPILELLHRHLPSDENERRSLVQIIRFVEENESCFERDCSPGHITGSAWILDSTGSRVALTHHAKLGRWLQPGGHADGESDILNVARREGIEETGISSLRPISDNIFDVDVHLIPQRGGVPEHRHFDVRFAFMAGENAALTRSEESIDLAWVPLERLEEYSEEESLLRMKRKWLASRG